MPLENLKHNGKILSRWSAAADASFGVTSAAQCECLAGVTACVAPKNVVDEMQFVHEKYGVDQVTFYDDAFSVDRNRVLKICEELQARKLKLMWDCGTRVDMVDRELMKTMREAGCIAVWMGVESGSEAILGAMNKSIKLDQTTGIQDRP